MQKSEILEPFIVERSLWQAASQGMDWGPQAWSPEKPERKLLSPGGERGRGQVWTRAGGYRKGDSFEIHLESGSHIRIPLERIFK